METATSLQQAIADRTARVAVVGAGYVGLSAAVLAARAGFPVTALDRDPERVRQIAAGRSPIRDVSDAELTRLVGSGRLAVSSDPDLLAAADVILVCVPTPITANRDPDLSAVQAATGAIADRLRPGQLISLESTTYPGTTEELVLPALTAGGHRLDQDFFLAFCPERIDPGNTEFKAGELVRVVGGASPTSQALAVAFYTPLAAGVAPVSSPRAAELTKLFENTYRAVNIALVNELTLLCDRIGLDAWEVLEAAATKRFGIQVFRPGPGVGGHCIPVDPHYLAWKAREYDFTMHFVELASEINGAMPHFVVAKLGRLLNEAGKPLRGTRILLLGVAYKADVADVREAPALRVIELLHQAEAQVSYHDPWVPELSARGRQPALTSVDLTADLLASLDAAVVLTAHSGVDYQAVVDGVALLLDTRNATRDVARGRERIRRL